MGNRQYPLYAFIKASKPKYGFLKSELYHKISFRILSSPSIRFEKIPIMAFKPSNKNSISFGIKHSLKI